MFFGSKQLSEKNAYIQELEHERVELKNRINELVLKNQQLEEIMSTLNQKASEKDASIILAQQKLKEKVEQVQDLEDVIQRLQEQLLKSTEQNEIRIKANKELLDGKKALECQVVKNKNLSSEQYLKLGTDLFDLATLTAILKKAQSESFITLQNQQRHFLLQRLLNSILTVTCPIRTDLELIKLLDCIEKSKVNQEIRDTLDEVKIKDIIDSKNVILGDCILHKKRIYPVEQKFAYYIDTNTPDEYVQKMAVGRLINILKQIVDVSSIEEF